MIPTDFKESTRVLTKPASMTDEDCGSLSVYSDGLRCVSCWKMSLKERISALLFGKVWLIVLSGQTQPPVSLSCEKTVFVKGGSNNDK